MATRDLVNNIGVLMSLAPGATGAGAGADLRGYESAAVLLSGDGTAATSALAVEESDDATSWNAVAAADLLNGPLEVVQGGTARVGYRGDKRYIRVNATVTTGNISASIVAGDPHALPAADPGGEPA